MRGLLTACALVGLCVSPVAAQNKPAMKFEEAADLMRGTALIVAQAEACGAPRSDLNRAVQGALMIAGRPASDFEALHMVYGMERGSLPQQVRENCDARADALERLERQAPR